MIDFNGYEQNDRLYGGLSGTKIGIIYQDAPYLLKYPGNLKNNHMQNVMLSYSNSPVCEYLGSHIYELLGIPVHQTLLGMRNNKVVVACKDFLHKGDRLYEFREIKATFESPVLHSDGAATLGDGTDLDEILETIKGHPSTKKLPELEKRFWDMFIVDAYIGNSDRNNGNWGIVSRYDSDWLEIAPVYDNGGCLNNKWDDEKMKRFAMNPLLFKAQAYKGVICAFAHKEKRINPFKYLSTTKNKECIAAIQRIVPRLQQQSKAIQALICENPVLTDVQKNFYCKILGTRRTCALQPVFEKNFSMGR